MPHQVTIKPSNHVFTAADGETILDGALREGFNIAYGCRDGACGSCKGKLLEGRVDYGAYQSSALLDTEKTSGYALFCQAKPLSDITIECREISALKEIQVRTLPCRVQKLQRLAPDVMMLQLKLPASERLQFLAGHRVVIEAGAPGVGLELRVGDHRIEGAPQHVEAFARHAGGGECQ